MLGRCLARGLNHHGLRKEAKNKHISLQSKQKYIVDSKTHYSSTSHYKILSINKFIHFAPNDGK